MFSKMVVTLTFVNGRAETSMVCTAVGLGMLLDRAAKDNGVVSVSADPVDGEKY